MKYHFDKRYIYITLAFLGALCGAILFYYLIFHSSVWTAGVKKCVSVMMPIIDGFVIAYLLNPCVYYFENRLFTPLLEKFHFDVKKRKIRSRIRIGAILLSLLIWGLCIYFILLLMLPQLGESLSGLVKTFPDYVNHFTDSLSTQFDQYPDLNETLDAYLDESAVDVSAWITNKILPQFNTVLSTGLVRIFGVVKFLWNLIIGLIISIYILSSKELFLAQLKKIMFALLPEKRANSLIDEVRDIHATFGGFITGKLIDSFIIGCLCFIGTTILQMPYALLISVIIGITNIIPFFGPFLGAIPSAFLVLVVDPKKCLYFLIFVFLLQQLDGNFIGPKILGESTGLSGFWVIFSITIFGGMFGVLGMFVGVPIFAVIYAGVKRFINRKLRDRKLPEDTTAYMKLRHIHEGTFEFVNQDFKMTDQIKQPVKIVVSIDKPEEEQGETQNEQESGDMISEIMEVTEEVIAEISEPEDPADPGNDRNV